MGWKTIKYVAQIDSAYQSMHTTLESRAIYRDFSGFEFFLHLKHNPRPPQRGKRKPLDSISFPNSAGSSRPLFPKDPLARAIPPFQSAFRLTTPLPPRAIKEFFDY